LLSFVFTEEITFKVMQDINLNTRKNNVINWISSLQDSEILEKVEEIKKGTSDWWDKISDEDKTAIREGLNQLDKGMTLNRSQSRARIKKRFNI
jgi:hypothetical protein